MRIWIAGVTLAVSSILLFSRLGHNGLWDDEAITAMTADGVWRTGDTSIAQGNNFVLYRNALAVRNFKDRATPPLQFYLAAPSIGLLGRTPFAARLPFAFCGLLCIALILFWLIEADADGLTAALTALAILGNVSLFLFFRQCRYYSPTMLITTACAYRYFHLTRPRRDWLMSAMLLSLAATNYLTFAAVAVAMAIDYFTWQRRDRRPALRLVLIILLPVLLGGAIVGWVWNPLRLAEPAPVQISWIKEHATLLWWNLRDLNRCEFGPGWLLIAAPGFYFIRRNQMLLRSWVATAAMLVVISALSPQHTQGAFNADVRYLCVIILGGIAMSVLALRELAYWSRPAALLVGAMAFFTTTLKVSATPIQNWRITPALFVEEILSPPPEPITPTAEWIKSNVSAGQLVLVVPANEIYPLMFLAPGPTYGWQLKWPPAGEFTGLPAIHFEGQAPPDFIIYNQPRNAGIAGFALNVPQPVSYRRVAMLNVCGQEAFRPELFWHQFTFTPFDAETQGVLIFKRTDLAGGP